MLHTMSLLPFYKEPLLSALGVLANTESAEQILQGSFEVPPELDPHTKAIIGLLQRPPTNKCLDITAFHMTADKIAKAWKRRRPNTQGEPTGLSFLHHIVGVHHPIIAEVDAALHSAPQEVGFAPACWLTMTDVELLKKPGVFDVELMRTIQLMNTFFNMCNILSARMTMVNAEQHRMFSPTQFGGHKFHMAITAVCIILNYFDYLRFRHQAGVATPEDQAKCYDYFCIHLPPWLSAAWVSPTNHCT